MGQYAKEAKNHADMIRYYYEHADSSAYSQAEPYYLQLSDLIIRADKSKNDQNDIVVIQTLRDSSDRLMQEMKDRADN